MATFRIIDQQRTGAVPHKRYAEYAYLKIINIFVFEMITVNLFTGQI